MNKEAKDLAQILGFNIEHRATNIMLERFFKKAQESEREACAKILDEMAEKDKLSNYYVVAALAIRSRGQK